MSKTITVRITKRHIEEGKQGDGNGCAIALALKDRLTLAKSVFVDDSHIEVNGGALKPSFEWQKLPRAVRAFVNGFDEAKHSVKPFSFKMEVPKGW